MITGITSDDNSKLKLVRRLSAKKHRDADRLFVIEGENSVRAALDADAEVSFVLISDDEPELAKDLEALSTRRTQIYSVSRHLLEDVADAGNGVSTIAVVSIPDWKSQVDEILSDSGSCVLVLDHLQDPGNMGTIIRTAAAAGYDAVIAIKGTADAYQPKVTRATAGLIFDVPLIYVDDAASSISMLKRSGSRIVVTTTCDGKDFRRVDMTSGVAIVIGNEGAGVSADFIEAADELVSIPMAGNVESLNAAVSAALLMYEKNR